MRKVSFPSAILFVALAYLSLSLVKKRGEILRWLSHVEYEKHHKQAKSGLLENTGEWLLEAGKFRDWRSSSASGILWLRGRGKLPSCCPKLGYRAYQACIRSWRRKNETCVGNPELHYCRPLSDTESYTVAGLSVFYRLESEATNRWCTSTSTETTPNAGIPLPYCKPS